jgi:hypothetical protein
LLLSLTVAVAVAFSIVPRFGQPQSYHDFADQRSFLGIPRFADVISNLPFAVVGLWGVIFVLRTDRRRLTPFLDSRERWPYLIAFAGIFLTALGSAYYHLDPNNARLVWDRLPIMIAFTATTAAMVTERVEVRTGLILLPVFLTIGIASVLQWYATELRGAGDLRFYAAVQVGATLILLLVLAFPARYTRGSDIGIMVGLYALAKMFELLDKPIFRANGWISGHTLKHLAAAAAGYRMLRMLQNRKPLAPFAIR